MPDCAGSTPPRRTRRMEANSGNRRSKPPLRPLGKRERNSQGLRRTSCPEIGPSPRCPRVGGPSGRVEAPTSPPARSNSSGRLAPWTDSPWNDLAASRASLVLLAWHVAASASGRCRSLTACAGFANSDALVMNEPAAGGRWDITQRDVSRRWRDASRPFRMHAYRSRTPGIGQLASKGRALETASNTQRSPAPWTFSGGDDRRRGCQRPQAPRVRPEWARRWRRLPRPHTRTR